MILFVNIGFLKFFNVFSRTRLIRPRRTESYANVSVNIHRERNKSFAKQEDVSKPKNLVKKKEATKLVCAVMVVRIWGIWGLMAVIVRRHLGIGRNILVVCQILLGWLVSVLMFLVKPLLGEVRFTRIDKSRGAGRGVGGIVYYLDTVVHWQVILFFHTLGRLTRLAKKIGRVERAKVFSVSGDLISIIHDFKREVVNHIEARPSQQKSHLKESYKFISTKKPKIAVVGSGPSGLFASLVLAELGAEVTLIERGQPVEKRGRDIGALVVRRMLQLESNFCFGEGGAGTWSDGKLVTRIGRNSDGVVAVLKTLVHFGAPRNILVDGKPHLGTDRLVPLLRNFRQHLQGLGVTIRFGTRVDDLLVENAKVVGVKVSDTESDLLLDNQKLGFDAIVLAVGHSARDVYQMLHSNNVELVPKDFSVGLRIEHPQELINRIQYSTLANEVCKGRGKVPVADYKVVKYVDEEGTDANSRENGRSCYSFCMCPGGQVVLTSTNPSELCINGMSFSRRASRWANAALVVTISWKDFDSLGFHGPLAGIEFQREFERRAALMGGGNFVVPVQKHLIIYSILALVVDVPPSSYRLGVKSAELHDLYPNHITEALQNSISMFDRELPGFISEEALLHGVETRTSAPVQIPRNTDTYESTSLEGLYPIGEGAGYAGGIVSAAVDGLYAGFAVAKNLNLYTGCIESILGKPMKNTGFVKY
ncbi:hypothetical protein Scep_023566 [Stephania cephalantha]|uniref:FAD-binding domain-containing protein n=1 Tax=Stephania cephalantha TaxID=152367 RepID=A0AAP0EVY3_9MAGN